MQFPIDVILICIRWYAAYPLSDRHLEEMMQERAVVLDKAMRYSEVPGTVTLDKSGANKAALDQLNAERGIPIGIRQVKYLNNIVEQDHHAIKRVTRSMLGFKSFRAAQAVLAGIELMHMIRKGPFNMAGCEGISFADQFYTLAGQARPA
jgi:putative transposase